MRGRGDTEILFASSYLYNNLGDFRRIGQSLPDGLGPAFLFVPDDEACGKPLESMPEGVSTLGLSPFFNDNRFGSAGLATVVRRKFTNFAAKYRNFSATLEFLKQRRPALVAVSSDLGPLNMCFLLEACRLLGIPVVILYAFDLTPEQRPSLMDPLLGWLDRSALPWLRFLRAYLYYRCARQETPGLYSSQATVCVVSDRSVQTLVDRGVQRSRIRLIKPLGADSPSDERAGCLRAELGLSPDRRAVAFFTECIHEVYGRDYAERSCREAAQALRQASARTGAAVIVKFHPREPDEMRRVFRKAFGWPGVIVLDRPEVDAADVAAVADLSIAHFSKVLLDAALAGRPFVSINFLGDRKRTFVPAHESADLEAADLSSLELRVRRFLLQPEERSRVTCTVLRLAKELAPSGATALSVIQETVKA